MCDKRNQLADNISYLIENWREVPVANTKVLMENFPFILPPQEHWDKVVKTLKCDDSSHHHGHHSHQHEPDIPHCYEECFDPTSKEAADWYSDEWESDYDDDDDDFYHCEGEVPHYPPHCPAPSAPAPSPHAPAPAPSAHAPAPAPSPHAPAPAPSPHAPAPAPSAHAPAPAPCYH